MHLYTSLSRARLFQIAAIAMVILVAWPSEVSAQETSRRKFIKDVKAELAELDASEAYTRNRCRLRGIVISENAIVIAKHDQQSPAQLGDKITAVNNQNLSPVSSQSAVAILSNIPTHVTVDVVVQRNGEQLALQIPCGDSLDVFGPYRAALRAAANGDFEGCIQNTSSIRARHGPDGQTGWLEYNCAYHAGRFKDPRAWVLAYYEYLRLGIDQLKWDPNALASLRAVIIANRNFFEYRQQLALFRELEDELEAAARTLPTSVAKDKSPRIEQAEKASSGSGFFVSPNGLVITSAHVVRDARTIRVTTASDVTLDARVIAVSEATDLAVLQVPHSGARYLSLAAPRSAAVGTAVFTYGYPVADLLGSEPKFTEGSISALSGIGGEQSFLQISVPVQPGNSGGPLLNDEGYVVGVIAAQAAVLPFLKGTGTLPQNINWAVKAEYASLLADLPPRQVKALNRETAIAWVREAIVYLEVER